MREEEKQGKILVLSRAEREVVKGRGRKHGKDEWENMRIQKPVEIFSPKGSVSRYVYYSPLFDSDYPFGV